MSFRRMPPHKEYPWADQEDHLVVRGVARALKDLLLLLSPPLVVEVDGIQEVLIQDDHLAVFEEVEAIAIVNEAQVLEEEALQEGVGGSP
jgi:hypothetical protein